MPARTELDPGASCRTCGQPLPPGKAVCPSCGAANGEANRCPHCNAVADVEPHAALGFRCLVCGGPRVALDVPNVAPGARTRAALQDAGREQTKVMMFGAAGFALAAMGLIALAITTVVILTTSPPLLPSLAGLIASSVPAVAGLVALTRAAAARQLRGEAVQRAQVSALGDVQAVTGVLDAPRVSEIMRIGPERAELLLAEASVATLLNESPEPRWRVEEPAKTELGEPSAEALGEAQSAQARGRTARGDTEI
jgi:hypothetical protein